jgi:hypothetical protein
MNARQTLYCLKSLPIEESILICGNHGIGKSQIVRQAARELGASMGIENFPCVDFRLSQNDVGDLKGMPFHVRGRTVFAPPEFFPLRKADEISLKEFLGLTYEIQTGRYGDYGILFLDEIDRANREVQQAAFELVLDRRLNLRSLPDGWRVASAINAEGDIYTVNSLDPAFLSRFFMIPFNPTVEEWLAWAITANVHPVIVEFIRRNNNLLDPTKELLTKASTEGITKVHDRRAWHKFSTTIWKLVKDYEEGLANQDDETGRNPLGKDTAATNWMFQLAGGYVSTIAQSAFKRFLETDYQSLDADIILNKWSDTVEARLKEIIKKGRITEIAAYNELITAWVKENVDSKELSEHQSHNLALYLDLLPGEPVADFWKKFNKQCDAVSKKWYMVKSLRNEPNHKIILRNIINPTALKKQAAAATA